MLDTIDIKVLEMLQDNGRIKRSEIAEAVGLSLPSLSERIKKLEDRGIIKGYFTKINKESFGIDIMAIINVYIDSSKNYSKFAENVQKMSQILECYSVLGSSSHIIKVVVKNTAELERLLAKIQSWPGINHTVTSFVLSTIKETSKINLSIKE